MSPNQMKVALTCNLKSSNPTDAEAEWDDPETIRAVEKAISLKHDVTVVEANHEAPEKLARLKPDLVFNMAEGKRGPFREAQIPAILELLGIPYTGARPLTLALCLDKSWTKDVLAAAGIPVPRTVKSNGRSFASLRMTNCRDKACLAPTDFPLVVKPRWEGSSKGLKNSSLVRDEKELRREVNRIEKEYRQPALIEEYLPGREFTVALLGNGDAIAALPIVEVNLEALPASANRLYSYEAKWVWDTPEKPLPIFQCPAKIPAAMKGKIERLARETFWALECRDWARIDLRLDAEGIPHVLEVNPIPGILPNPEQNSCFPKAARAAGMSYEEMILRVIDLAWERTAQKVEAR